MPNVQNLCNVCFIHISIIINDRIKHRRILIDVAAYYMGFLMYQLLSSVVWARHKLKIYEAFPSLLILYSPHTYPLYLMMFESGGFIIVSIRI